MSLQAIKNFLWKTPEVDTVDEPHVTADVTETDIELYKEFIEEYDPEGKFEFNDLGFRKGAVNTCPFGLSEGYKMKDGKMVWGYVRIHNGVDRAGGGEIKGIEDIVQVPFDFNRSAFYEYGDKSYGTLTILFNDKYQFEMRIAHMNPDQNKRKGNEKGPLIPWSLARLKKKQSMSKSWLLGSAGTWGASSGAHTHTEFKSLDEACEVFEILLIKKYGEEALQEYTHNEVVDEYRQHLHYHDALKEDILKDYNELRKTKKVIFLNKYKCQYVDWDGTIKTRYASNLLFNGL